MFRVPFAMGSQEGLLQRTHPDAGNADAGAGGNPLSGGADSNKCFSADPWGLERPGDDIFELDVSAQFDDPRELPHLQLVREAMQYWQSYDAFARVSMSIGTNQLIMALCYYVLGYVLIANHAIVAAWLAVVLFLAIACALIRLDMSLSFSEFWIAVLLVSCGPICTAISTKEWAQNGTDCAIKWLMPAAYISHSLWMLFILKLSKIETTSRYEVQLPTGFRSVLYIDVFGWIKDNPIGRVFRRVAADNPNRQPGAGATPADKCAAGPAVQAVRYAGGPVPMRVDELPDASKSHLTAGISEETHKAGFGPSTFVPREKQDDESLYPNASTTKCGFRVDDSVMWTRADNEVLRGTEGKVVELPDDDEDEMVTVIFPAKALTIDRDNPPPPIRKVLPSHELKIAEVDNAGSRPWKVFCGATSLGAILWWITGMLVAMELHGVKYLVVSPLTRDEEETVVREVGSKFLQVGHELEAGVQHLEFGHELVTTWPHENIHALSLACNSGSHTIIASSQFALYAADLGTDPQGRHVEFKATPACQDIEGETLQDVSLQCGSQGGSCQAVVLTQQGRQLVKCEVAKSSNKNLLKKVRKPSVALISEEWLNDAGAAEDSPAESVRSLSIASQCEGDVHGCAYVGTSGDRIVEMQLPSNSEVDQKYFPHRLLQAKLNGTSGGSMDVIHSRYLGLLQEDGQHLQVLDLKKGGAVVDKWRIPLSPKNQPWSAMCAAGDNLYFFSEGHSPQLWRFPLPRRLRAKPVAKALLSQPAQAPQHSLLQRKTSRKHVFVDLAATEDSSE